MCAYPSKIVFFCTMMVQWTSQFSFAHLNVGASGPTIDGSGIRSHIMVKNFKLLYIWQWGTMDFCNAVHAFFIVHCVTSQLYHGYPPNVCSHSWYTRFSKRTMHKMPCYRYYLEFGSRARQLDLRSHPNAIDSFVSVSERELELSWWYGRSHKSIIAVGFYRMLEMSWIIKLAHVWTENWSKCLKNVNNLYHNYLDHFMCAFLSQVIFFEPWW